MAKKRGESALKVVYESYHAPALKSLQKSSPDKKVCLDELLGAACGPSAKSGMWVAGSKVHLGHVFQCQSS